jgi:hypothetical protein
VTSAPFTISSLRLPDVTALEAGETLDVGNVLLGDVSFSFFSLAGGKTSLLVVGDFSTVGALLFEDDEPAPDVTGPWLNASAAIIADAASRTSKMIFFVTESPLYS